MPLIQGKSQKAFGHNIGAEMDAGKPRDQALAIAYSMKRRADKKKMADGGEVSGWSWSPPSSSNSSNSSSSSLSNTGFPSITNHRSLSSDAHNLNSNSGQKVASLAQGGMAEKEKRDHHTVRALISQIQKNKQNRGKMSDSEILKIAPYLGHVEPKEAAPAKLPSSHPQHDETIGHAKFYLKDKSTGSPHQFTPISFRNEELEKTQPIESNLKKKEGASQSTSSSSNRNTPKNEKDDSEKTEKFTNEEYPTMSKEQYLKRKEKRLIQKNLSEETDNTGGNMARGGMVHHIMRKMASGGRVVPTIDPDDPYADEKYEAMQNASSRSLRYQQYEPGGGIDIGPPHITPEMAEKYNKFLEESRQGKPLYHPKFDDSHSASPPPAYPFAAGGRVHKNSDDDYSDFFVPVGSLRGPIVDVGGLSDEDKYDGPTMKDNFSPKFSLKSDNYERGFAEGGTVESRMSDDRDENDDFLSDEEQDPFAHKNEFDEFREKPRRRGILSAVMESIRQRNMRD